MCPPLVFYSIRNTKHVLFGAQEMSDLITQGERESRDVI